ncbi:MAG: lnt, partial [Acidimicrobiales bacterium]|nr:lnt [Acidimicrobiales bacterium]
MAGGLIALSLPPAGFWPLAFVGLALVDRLVADMPWKRRWKRGSLVGLALFGPTMFWMSELTAPGYVVAVLLFSAILGAFLALVPPGPGRRPALVGAWVLSEALRGVWPLGGVPMSTLAVGQVGGP